MRLLITGASPRSFVGSGVSKTLSDEHIVFAPSRSELDLIDTKAVRSYIKEHDVDAVVHCAVQGENSQNECEADLKMFFNLVACRDLYGKLVYFGSGAEFNKSLPIDGLDETAFGRSVPSSSYGFSKYIMNEYARTQSNIINLRLFSGYGINENYRIKFISGLCCKALLGFPLTIRKDCLFDFVWIEDIVNTVKWAVENQIEYADYNLSSGKGVLLSEVAQLIKDISGSKSSINILTDGLALPYVGNNQRLTNESGIEMTGLNVGITQMLKYFNDNIKEIDIDALKKNE